MEWGWYHPTNKIDWDHLEIQYQRGPAEVGRSQALGGIGLVILPVARLLDAFVALGDDGVGYLGIPVPPQGMGKEPVGVEPGGTPPDEPARRPRHELGVRGRHRGQGIGQPEVVGVPVRFSSYLRISVLICITRPWGECH